jgi:hypothetical protein
MLALLSIHNEGASARLPRPPLAVLALEREE